MRYLILFLFCSPLIASEYYLRSGKKVVSIPFQKVENALVSDICLRKDNKCIALKKLKTPLKKISHKDNNPAKAYCLSHGGIFLTLFDKKLVQSRGFCAFEDKSIISAWDLYSSIKAAK